MTVRMMFPGMIVMRNGRNNMTYTPGMKTGSYGDKGQAKVLVNSKNPDRILVRLHAQTWDKQAKAWSYEDKEFKLNRSDCPDEVQPVIHTTDNAFVGMSSKGDKIYRFSPWIGQFVGKFVGFAVAKGQELAPATYQGEWSYQYMNALVEITKGEFKGSRIAYMLRYHFAEGDENGKPVVVYDHPKSKYTPVLMEFLEITGAWERGPIAYKDNILPILQKRMLAEDRTFKFVVKEGNIAIFFAGATPDKETVEEEPPF